MLSKSAQEFTYKPDGSGTNTEYSQEIEWKTTDLAVFYRMQRQGMYLEIGPMLHMVKSWSQTDEGEFSPENIDEYYEDQYISAVLGVGSYILGADRFTLMFGVRMGYSINDVISDAGQAADFPNPNRFTNYEEYKETHPGFVQLVLEFNFGIGYFAKASCSNRSTFISF